MLLDSRGRTSQLLKADRIPTPKHRKPRPTGFIEKELHALGFNENLKEFTLEFFIRGCERIKKNISQLSDEGMSANGFSRLRGIVPQKGRRDRRQTKHIANKTKGLKRRPGVWVELRSNHVEHLKDAHREVVKREGDV